MVCVYVHAYLNTSGNTSEPILLEHNKNIPSDIAHPPLDTYLPSLPSFLWCGDC